MPAKNAIKQYLEGGVYHIYNRGINKADIFFGDNDYKVFLYFLKTYLLEIDLNNEKEIDYAYQKRNFSDSVELWAYCLMPNHFHFLIKQRTAKDISEFMRCLMTSYVLFINKKYDRQGPLFQGRYKAILVDEDRYLLHLSRYIHANPLDLKIDEKFLTLNTLEKYSYSSYGEYVGKRGTKWIKPSSILEMLGHVDKNSLLYENFMKSYDWEEESQRLEGILFD